MDDILAEARHELLVVATLFGLFLCMSMLLVWQVYCNWQKVFEAENELKCNYERLKLMQEVSQYHATNVQDLLDFSLDRVIALTESSIGYIYHYSEENQQFVLNSWSKGVMDACSVVEPQSLYKLEKTGLWGEVVRQRKPIVINDFAAENPLKKGNPAGHVPLSRFMSIPVFDNDMIVAVVGVSNKLLPYDQTDALQLSLMMEGVWKIAARLKMEEQIARAGREWQSTFDAISDSIALIDNDQRIMRCNLATCEMLGSGFTDIIHQPCWKLFHGADALVPDCPMAKMKLSLQSETSTIRHGDRWLEVTVDPILSDSGVLAGAVHLVRNVTERKRLEDELFQEKVLYKDLVDTQPAGMYRLRVRPYSVCDATGHQRDRRRMRLGAA
jgi:PAS domain S-box-containing protein